MLSGGSGRGDGGVKKEGGREGGLRDGVEGGDKREGGKGGGGLELVRWHAGVAWSPWNCCLMTSQEAKMHKKVQHMDVVSRDWVGRKKWKIWDGMEEIKSLGWKK